ncbi:MAG: ribonuclease D [Alphaproteobacteria bacterium]|nr:ribonuclease D [Alphaproteobacteria bacterium]MBN2675176.1 ribonuclease D [Alphaproteobacteria bacterium]
MNIIYLEQDLSAGQVKDLSKSHDLAVDTELTGLDVHSDKLCLVQLRARDSEDYYLIQIRDGQNYPNLVKLLSNPKITKIFHYARMDLLMIYKRLGVWAIPVFCTKIGVLLARPKKGHALHNVLRELFNVEMDGGECCSDWTKKLTSKQKKYAATDVMYLHILKDYLSDVLVDKNQFDLAKKCFEFLPTRCALDMDWGERDIFGYNPK